MASLAQDVYNPSMTTAYFKLAQYLDRLPAGYPPSEDGVEIKLLQALFTEQEAELAQHLTLLPEEAHVVAYRAHLPVEVTAQLLTQMAAKGLISANHFQHKPTTYAISQFVVGFWEGQVNQLREEVVRLFEAYAPVWFAKGAWKQAPQLRTIPVNETIPITSEVMSYYQLEDILRSKQKIAVRNCVCRQERELVGAGCGKPMETCLSFDNAALNTVRAGIGRMISVDEALAIVEQAQRAGLVLQPANSQDPIFVCMCCSCCCGVLRHLKREPNPGSLVANAYIAQHNEEDCILCGACVDVCPMEALVLGEDGSLRFEAARCIGCGLCASECPNGAMQIQPRPAGEIPVTPKNTLHTYYKLAKAGGRWHTGEMTGMVVRSMIDRVLAPRSPN